MPAQNAIAAKSEEARSISATRLLDAPPDQVFEMFTDPKHLANWWGPRGFTITTHEFAFKPGGTWRFIMHGPDGRDYKNEIIFREIVRPQRIVYSHVSTPPFEATITLVNRNGKTEVTMRGVWESEELRNNVVKQFNAIQGMQDTMDRLGEAVAQADAFVISRTFDAPRDLMWKTWTDEKQLAKWFGPKGVTGVHSKNDMRPEGVYHYALRTPDGNTMWGKWVYREIVPPKRLVFVSSFSDEKGGVTRHPMAPDWPRELLSTITFDERDGKTTVTVKWAPINANDVERKVFEAGRSSMTQGWTGTFDRLEQCLAGGAEMNDLKFTRTFDAPREVVFEAWTDGKQMAKWFGPRGFTTEVKEHDARPGGLSLFVMRGPDGTEYPGKAIFREILKPQRLVMTIYAVADREDLLETLITVTFEEKNKKTTMNVNVNVARSTPEAKPYIGGMEEGWKQTLDKLGEVVMSSGR